MRARREPSQERLVMGLASLTSVFAALYYFRTDQVLLYGDAVAHINIARRVVDNITPGPFQLGTVWLPLPHVLTLPFVWHDGLWVSGVAGMIPSMVAYVVACVGIFRLLRLLSARIAAWIGTALFALNPNLLYIQSTAMTESIYLAGMIWAVYYLCDFDLRLRDRLPEAGSQLVKASFALTACILTRYDGWFLAGVAAIGVAVRLFSLEEKQRRALWRPAIKAALVCSLFAGFWLAWNFGIFGNPLEFATGPYSAKAIAERSTTKTDPPYPGKDHPKIAVIYFLKAAKLTLAEGHLENVIFGVALFGVGFTLFEKRRRFVLLLLVPLIFYAFSIAYGAVPIFIPQWWPFSYYNARYGMQLLPALCVFVALASHYLRRVHWTRTYVHVITGAFVLLGIACYYSVWMKVPIDLREARANSVTRIAMEKQIARQLMFRASDEKVLMFTGEYSGALQRARLPFKQVINEGNYGIWQSALRHPSQSADWIVATEGDEISQAVAADPEGVVMVSVLHTTGKRPVTIYHTPLRGK
jgi:hypothetical protein